MTTKIPVELSSTPSIVDGGNATAITIDSSERVGIGTTSPASNLHISATGEARLIVEGDSDNDSGEESALIELRTDGGAVRHRVEATGTGGNDLKITAGADQTTNTLNSEIIFETKTANSSTAERMKIDADGNVGIGVSSIVRQPLQVHRASTSDVQIHMTNSATGSSASDGMTIFSNSTTSGFWQRESANMLFATSGSERMRIASSGVVAIGKTSDDSTTAGIWLRKHSTGGHGQIMCTGSGSSAYEGLYVRDITNSEMEFMASYHGTLYYRTLAPLSDERKKDNVQNITLGLDAVKELRPVSFDWKNNKGNDQLGFIAQEVEATSLKQLVSTYKDENIEDLRTLNKEGLIPVLVKAIQEQQEQIEALQSEINTLKGGE